MDYQYQTIPYPHQDREFLRSRDAITWALFLEQRTGKSKLTIDTAAYNYELGRIDGLLIVAPPGVHAQWIIDEIPLHLPVRIPWVAHIWRTGKAPKQAERDIEILVNCNALAIMAINTQALITPAGKKAVLKFLKGRKVLFAFDESDDIRTPSNKTTRTAIKLGEKAVMRRILAGVPAPEGPMDYYSQFAFLHRKILNLKNFLAFKLMFGEWEFRVRDGYKRVNPEEAIGQGRLRPGIFMMAKKDAQGHKIYKNLDLLHQLTDRRISRVTQKEAFPHLPEKQYKRVYVDLDPEQIRLYNELSEDFEAELDGRVLTARLLITRMIRFQQVICGYLPMPAKELEESDEFNWFGDDLDIVRGPKEIVPIPGCNQRMEALDAVLTHRGGGPAIIWARFAPDIDLLMGTYAEATRYDGTVDHEERDEIKADFVRGKIPLLIGNQKAGGRGLSLKGAETVVYWSNYYGLLPRAQSEERPIHAELKRPVQYVDIVARNTMEERLVDSLQHKRNVFEELMGDRSRLQAWFGKAA